MLKVVIIIAAIAAACVLFSGVWLLIRARREGKPGRPRRRKADRLIYCARLNGRTDINIDDVLAAANGRKIIPKNIPRRSCGRATKKGGKVRI